MKNLNESLKQFLLLALMFVFTIQSCTKDEEPENNPVIPQTHERGEISKSTSLGTFTPNDIQQILDAGNIQIPFTLNYSVNVLSVNYYTVDKDDSHVLASGAMMIPQSENHLPSAQHRLT